MSQLLKSSEFREILYVGLRSAAEFNSETKIVEFYKISKLLKIGYSFDSVVNEKPKMVAVWNVIKCSKLSDFC